MLPLNWSVKRRRAVSWSKLRAVSVAKLYLKDKKRSRVGFFSLSVELLRHCSNKSGNLERCFDMVYYAYRERPMSCADNKLNMILIQSVAARFLRCDKSVDPIERLNWRWRNQDSIALILISSNYQCTLVDYSIAESPVYTSDNRIDIRGS